MALMLGGISAAAAVSLPGAHPAVASWRNFYGILRVTDLPDPHGAMRELTHGRIKHGSQYLEQALRDRPISYYGPHSGVAMALSALPTEKARQIAVIGLGTGTIAAWGRPGDLIRFYEINPVVPTIARWKIEYFHGIVKVLTRYLDPRWGLEAPDLIASSALSIAEIART